MLGTKELNKKLQSALNPEDVNHIEKSYGDVIFREGDKVMQIKNNYDIYWEKENEAGTGIFNGEFGIIKKINNNDRQIEVEFDDGKVAWYTFTELEELEHAYSITIHKAQRK